METTAEQDKSFSDFFDEAVNGKLDETFAKPKEEEEFETEAEVNTKEEKEEKEREDNTTAETVRDEDRGGFTAVPEGDPTETTATTESIPSGENDSALAQKVADLEAALQAEQHKTASWNGRIRASEQRAKAAEAALEDLKARQKETKTTDTGKGYSIDTNSSDEKILKDFMEEFPDLVGPIELVSKKVVDQMLSNRLKDIEPKLEAMEERAELSAEERHFAKIEAAHRDYATILSSDHFLRWIDIQPPLLKTTLERIYQEGTASEIIETLTEYKNIHKKTKTIKKEVAKGKADALTAVPTTGSGAPTGVAFKDKKNTADYDAAYAEAIAS